MNDQTGPYLGFDPGGDRKFGVAFLDRNHLTCSTVSTVVDAVEWAIDACGGRKPIAAGIDTLLHWSIGRSGMRPCDLWLRQKHPAVRNSVIAANSLRGAMAIGGMALALRLRQVWPEIELNETHPKVLFHALGAARYVPEALDPAIQWFADRATLLNPAIKGEHQFDAALSAWATREGDVQGWHDIIGGDGDLLFPAGSVRYLWPTATVADKLT